MSRFLKFANEWLLSWQQTGPLPDRRDTAAPPRTKTQSRRPRKHLGIEQMEERVLLSTADLAAHARHATAEVLRTKRGPTLLAGVAGSGVQGGSATLVATLTSNGSPLAGKTIRFQISGRIVGSATTNPQGIAILPNARLRGLRGGSYPRGRRDVRG